ncbi:molybdate ABC transporter substrate-binding protein [Parahaliea mediterranea]|uniref:molybdate ABC transporter substrate-binding protein n=1 Tax=Parahaliea mediterranea TaxID=651086 RepID=UPI000E2EFEC2|nr:molybdate ABC transporter substrate-binding protein [Parahaliea mediterranea]
MRLLCLLCLLISLPAQAGKPLRVAVAANFRMVLEALAPAFEQATGTPLSLSSASTGVLYNQIRHGAPFDVLLAADSARPMRLEAEELGAHRRCYALGQLVLVGSDTLDALANPALSLAIANPTTAPYGLAAEQVLARPAFAAGATRKLVQGSNVVQTWQFWHSRNVDLALVPRSLAGSQGVAIPESWYEPLRQEAVVITGGQEAEARRFLDWLASPAQQARLQDAGYGPCP